MTVPRRFSHTPFTLESFMRSSIINFALLPQPMLGAALQTRGTTKKLTSWSKMEDPFAGDFAGEGGVINPKYGNEIAAAAIRVALQTPILFQRLGLSTLRVPSSQL